VKGTSLGKKTRSCGCINRKHGQANVKTAEYKAWGSMLRRCYNKNSANFERYGGRGITVCDRWREFAAFFEDMGPRPSPQHSLDRVNNAGNYEAQNCRWATRSQQNANTRVARPIFYRGETVPLTVLARRLGIDAKTVVKRLANGTLE